MDITAAPLASIGIDIGKEVFHMSAEHVLLAFHGIESRVE